MTTILDPRSGGIDGEIVTNDDAPRRSPPLLAVGPLAWMRKDLFSSWFDTLLTFIAIAIVVSLLVSFVTWVIGQANWFVINDNLRLFLIGRYPIDALWRINLLAAITAFAGGLSLAAWARVTRLAAVIVVVALALIFIIPPLIYATIPLAPTNVAAGSVEIASGTAKQTPQAQVGFIAQSGDTISIRIADQYSANDQALSTVYGFSDDAASLVANAAANRLSTADRIASLNDQLASDLLTDNQRARLTTQLGKLQVPPPISDAYQVNQGAVNVRILNGSTLEPLASGTLTSGSQPVTVTLPADGWYVLEKIPADKNDQSVALLEVKGVSPILERQITVSGDLDASGNATGVSLISEYVLLPDGFTTRDIRPAVDGKNLPMATLIDNSFRGDHTFQDYLRLFVAPFLDLVKLPLLLLVGAGAVGYVVGRLVDRYLSPAEKPRKLSRRFATWLLIALPIIMFALVYGVGSILPLTDTRRWGGLLLTVMLTLVGIVASFPIGILLAQGRRSHLPVVSAASTLYIEFVRGVPLITVLFMAQLLLPLVNPSLVETPNVFRAMIAITLFNAAYLAENVRGGLQSIPPGQEEAAKALGLNSLQISLYITLPQALRAVLPALVGMVISLFKDTSLVAIVGLLDLTGIAQAIVTQTEFIGLRRETLLFITLIYFGISYAIAVVSRRIEVSGAGANRIQNI